MAYLRDELNDIIGAAEQRRKDARVRQLREVQSLGEVVSELQADPRWERFGRPIQDWLNQAESSVVTMEKRLTGSWLPPDEYTKTKIDQTYHFGRVQAFREVLNLAKRLITSGNQAKEEIENISA